MKSFIKSLGIGLLAGAGIAGITSCDDALDQKPITQITPQDYYKSADQLANYLNNYYQGHLTAPFSGVMFHNGAWNDGMNSSDGNTDIVVNQGGSTAYYADNMWQTGSDKSLQPYYANVRVWNYFLNVANENYAKGDITGDNALIRNYIGEGYFFRALCYFNILARYGDAPIVKGVLADNNEDIVAASQRAPRNEVARYIIANLDTAISMLADRDRFRGQRVNKQVALLLKSRVALFEGTFEKYHKGSGRVPGDQEWPGAKMSYNAGKTFDIDSEVRYFLTEAMNAAKEAVGSTSLTANNFVTEPEVGTIAGWNPYFEMYSQPSLADVPEVLLWREYNTGLSVSHDVACLTLDGSSKGFTRAFMESFLMTDGKPCYASDLYKGDVSIDNTKVNRDYRMQLFVWSESTLAYADNRAPSPGGLFGVPKVNNSIDNRRNNTGYQSRKYFCYDYSQTRHDEQLGYHASPNFRVAEGMLNYMEACVELNGNVDATATGYWHQLRERAGVDQDFNVTIANTDMSKELLLSAYSGTNKVSPLLFNVRRERACETFNEGLRMADLIRWRSFDPLLTTKYVPEGCNFWDEMYLNEAYADIVADGSSNAQVSRRERGKYLQPLAIVDNDANLLRDGMGWHEAYYLMPLGSVDITSASPDRTPENSNLYQNPGWPAEGGRYCLK